MTTTNTSQDRPTHPRGMRLLYGAMALVVMALLIPILALLLTGNDPPLSDAPRLAVGNGLLTLLLGAATAAICGVLWLRERSEWLLLLGSGAILWGSTSVLVALADILSLPSAIPPLRIYGSLAGASLLAAAAAYPLARRRALTSARSAGPPDDPRELRVAFGASLAVGLGLGLLFLLAAARGYQPLPPAFVSALTLALCGATTLISFALYGQTRHRPYYWQGLAAVALGAGTLALNSSPSTGLLSWLGASSLNMARVLLACAAACALAQSQMRVLFDLRRALFGSSPDGILLLDLDGRLVDANPAAIELLSINGQEDLLLSAIQRLASPRDRPRLSVFLQTAQQRGLARERNFVLLAADGDERPVDLTASVLRGADDQPNGLLVLLRDIRQRLDSERALRLQARLLDAVHDAVLAVGRDGKIAFWGRGAERVFGLSKWDAEGSPIQDRLPADETDDGWLRNALDRALAGEAVSGPFRAARNGGTAVTTWMTLSPLRHVEDDLPAVIITASDITDLLAANEALAQSEERYRRLIRTAPEGVMVLDAEALMSLVNEHMASMVGVGDPEELVGHSVFDLITDDEMADARDVWARLSRGEHLEQTEASLRRVDGTSLPVSFSASPLPGPGPAQTVVFARDESERLAAQRSIAESERKLRSIVDQSEDGIALVDERGMVAEWNPALETISGIARDAVLGKPVWAVHAQVEAAHHNAQVFESHVRELVESFQRTGTGEWLHRMRQVEIPAGEGEARTIQVMVFPIRTEGGWMAGAIARDVTEWLRLEERMLASQKLEAVGQLAGGIAHEFNNLLTVINGYAQMLARALERGDPRAEYAQQIGDAGQRAAELVHQLLAYARRQLLRVSDLSLNAVVLGIEDRLRAMLGATVALDLALAPEQPTVRGDRHQIETILLSLVENAYDAIQAKIEATPRSAGSGRVTVGTGSAIVSPDTPPRTTPRLAPGIYGVFTVMDNGEGMDARVQAHLFEPFFSTRGVGQGTGLGLATVYGIVQQLNGAIQVETQVGLGTTMRVYLPLAGDDI